MQFEKYKGIHPGIVLARELEKRSIRQRPFCLLLEEHPQTFNAIIKGKRGLPISLALKIERQLGWQEGALSILQTYYDIEKEKRKIGGKMPDLSKLRKTLLWDTDIQRIDWDKQFKAIIRRVFERGSESEKREIEK
ncbi:MAG TPA: hypothetical protein VL943_07930, partial [Niabella sp.]|nr:hypothetical protein [Niabella sp.]